MYSTVHQVEWLQKFFSVPDLVPASARYIFVLESPHIHELVHSAPVSGSSGKVMARHLLGTGETPIGIRMKEALKTGKFPAPLDQIGLANICPIPMQAEAYPENVREDYQDTLVRLESLRKRTGTGEYRDPSMFELHQWVVQGLEQRLKGYDREGVTWIPCGRFAERFFGIVSSKLEHREVYPTPHPSFGNWDNQRGRPKVDVLKNRILVQRVTGDIPLVQN